MFGLHHFRNLKNGFPGFRNMPRRWYTSGTCFIRGTSQDIPFPMSMFESLEDHRARFPLVTKIPQGGIISSEPSKPYLINDHWRQILFSAFLHSYICKQEKDCIIKAFDPSNVGVLKGLNLVAFKKFDRQEGKINCDHEEYSGFVEGMFKKLGFSSVDHHFLECSIFVDACKTKGLPDDVLRYNTFFLDDEKLANFYSDTHRLLRQEFKHRGMGQFAVNILTSLEKCYSNITVVDECGKHVLFQFLLGSHCPNWRHAKKLSPSNFPGTAVVDVHRIAVHHAIEDNVMKLANLKYPPDKHPDLQILFNKFSRADVIKALRYSFPRYPSQALLSFQNQKKEVFDQLQMAMRLPTPSIYKYVSPVYENKEGPQGGTMNWNNRCQHR